MDENIQEFRKLKTAVEVALVKKGLQKKDLADYLDIPRSKLSIYLNEKKNRIGWSIYFLMKVAKFLDMKIEITKDGIKAE